jgi:hypothetical protein
MPRDWTYWTRSIEDLRLAMDFWSMISYTPHKTQRPRAFVVGLGHQFSFSGGWWPNFFDFSLIIVSDNQVTVYDIYFHKI